MAKVKPITWTAVRVKLGDLVPWEHNPRQSTKAQAERILQSFDEFGQVQTVAIDPDCEVLDGHQRLTALKIKHGLDYEVDARQSSRKLTEDERKRLVLMLHQGASGEWDWDNLSSWDSTLLRSSGFDEAMLATLNRDQAALIELFAVTPDFEPVGVDEQGRLDQKAPITCPHCGEEFIPA